MNFLESLQQTNEIASLPTVAAKLLQMLEQEDSDVRRIAHYVEKMLLILRRSFALLILQCLVFAFQ